MLPRCWQDTLTLKTYPRGPEDPNPPIQRFNRSNSVYPYPMQDDLLEGPAEMKEWTALHLENEYLHAIVLPELGGHLYSLHDKVCGREVFYRNNVVKYGLVATRGAWVSGGIEFNFPMGHTYTTVSPVSWEMGQDDDDGSVWLAVGNVCRVSRMEWCVELSLEAGARRLHERVSLHNPMDYKQRFWFWNNSAVPATNDLHLVYPARKVMIGGRIYDYPVNSEGLDQSWYRNRHAAGDIFTLDVTEDFFGCHYTDSDFGMVNVASHEQVYGRKFFTWGTCDEGMMWVNHLTDEDGQYCEIQSGRFPTQAIWEFLPPHSSLNWEEWWMPENGMDGWVYANEDVVLNLVVEAEGLRIGALASVPLGKVRIALQAEGRTPWQATVELTPEKPLCHELPMPFGCDGKTEFELTVMTEEGDILAEYHCPPAYTKKPKVAETGEDQRPPETPEAECSAEQLSVKAATAMKRLDHREARRLYEVALSRDAGYSMAHLGLGILDYRAAEYECAREHLEKALARDADNPEILYYLALARAACKDFDGAFRALTEARRRGHDEVVTGTAKLSVELASEPLGEAIFGDTTDDWWKLRRFGLHSYLRHRESGRETGLADFARWARGDVALWIEEALFLDAGTGVGLLRLAEEHCPGAADYAMIHYLSAHLNAKCGRKQQVKAALERARQCPLDFCFPSRIEELEALEAAVADDPTDWKARYLLGNVLAFLDRTDEAMQQWREAVSLDQSFAVLHRNLGVGCLQWEKNPVEAAQHYRDAIAHEAGDYHYYMDLTDLYERHHESLPEGFSQDAAGATDAELSLMLSAPESVQSKWQVAARTAELLTRTGKWEQALEILKAHHFFPWEGARHMHGLWVDCLTGRARERSEAGDHAAALEDLKAALTYPMNLGVGRPSRPYEAKVLWLAAEQAGLLNDSEQRKAYLQAAATEQHDQLGEAAWWKLLALRELGQTAEATELEGRLRTWAEDLTKKDDTAARGREMLQRLNG